MRIAIDARATQTDHRIRGIGRAVSDLIDALMAYGKGHEYGLLLQDSLPNPFQNLPDGFKVIPVSGSLLDANEMSWVMKVKGLRGASFGKHLNERLVRANHQRELRRALRGFKAEVFHATVPIDAFTDTTAQFEGRKVVTFYDAIPRLDPSRYYETMSSESQRLYDRQLAAVAHADAIVSISHSSRSEAIEFCGADPTRCFVVHLAVSNEFERESREEIEEYTCGRPYFLFLSALSPHKNPFGVLRAFAQAKPGIRLVYLSGHATELYSELRQEIDSFGLTDEVTITDTVSESTVRALVQGATALISPSFYEGFGLPAAQAMRAGIPVIVSNRKSQPEVVGSAGIMVDPDDIDALATAMSQIATDLSLREQLSKRSRERALLFSYERLAGNMIDVYEGRPPSNPIPGL